MSYKNYVFSLVYAGIVIFTGCSHSMYIGPKELGYDTIAVVARDPYNYFKEHAGMIEMIENRMCMAIKSKNFKIVERSELDRILKLQQISRSILTRDDNAAELGKALNAPVVLYIDVIDAKITESWKTKLLEHQLINNILNNSAPVHQERMKVYEAYVKIKAKLIDIEAVEQIGLFESFHKQVVFSPNNFEDTPLIAVDKIGENFPRKRVE